MEKVYAQGVENNTTANFIKEIVVPSTLANTNEFSCRIFQITYEIKVTCMTKGFSINPKVHIPITLGTIPLSFDDDFQPKY